MRMEPSRELLPGTLKGMRILVVEDSWHIAQALKSLLESLGCDVAGPVASTADAERLLAADILDAAVVDINLKGEKAYGLIESLGQRGIKVIVATGYAAPQIATTNVVAILPKPFKPGALLSVLQEIKKKPDSVEDA